MNAPARSGLTMPTKAKPAESKVEKTLFPLPEEATVLTVIIPVYNEAGTIDELLRQVIAAPYQKQVIVVDDGSTDGTESIVKRWEESRRVEVLQHSRNRGKGAAIRTGLAQAEGRFAIIQDAELEYDPQDYTHLIEPLVSGKADVVYGSRYLRNSWKSRQRWGLFRFGVSMLNACVRLLYGARLTDEATCYKAFPTAVLRSMEMECERFEFCPEVTAKACRMGLEITEVPIRYEGRTIQAGKKIRWTDGMAALGTLWRWRNWRPRGPQTTERVMLNSFPERLLGSGGDRT